MVKIVNNNVNTTENILVYLDINEYIIDKF